MAGSSTTTNTGHGRKPGHTDASVGRAKRVVQHPGPMTMKPSGTIIDRNHGKKPGSVKSFNG